MASKCNFPGFNFGFSIPGLPSLSFTIPIPVFTLAFDLPCPLD